LRALASRRDPRARDRASNAGCSRYLSLDSRVAECVRQVNNPCVKLDAWARDVLVDPFEKGPLATIPAGLQAHDGRVYPLVGGIYDLRDNRVDPVWQEGQDHYEAWSRHLIDDDVRQDYVAEIEGVRDVYKAISITGRVLDVGGHQGRLREFLVPAQEYLSCDPFIDVFVGIDRQVNLLEAYQCLAQPCNFVAAHAERLPFATSTFDTVHMRSVIDHFSDPRAALVEALRVLRPSGKLVIGLMVRGGKSGRLRLDESAKEVVREVLRRLGSERY